MVAAKELRQRLNRGQPTRDAKVTLADFTKEWIDTALAASDRKTTTKQMYAGMARTHIIGSAQLGSVGLNKIQPRHVEGWLVELRGKDLSTSTVRSVYTILRAILDTAVRDGALAVNQRRPSADQR